MGLVKEGGKDASCAYTGCSQNTDICRQMEEFILIVSVSVFLYLFLEVIWFTVRNEWRKLSLTLSKFQIRYQYRDVKVDDNLHRLLLKRSTYYQGLPDPLKKRFLIRTAMFMNYHSFEGRQGLEVTKEMAALISATAVQLTFGLDDFYMRHFDTIILYPDIYLSKATGEMHRGETNVKGVIVLSWKHFEEGIATDADKLNLGLHELAHALDLSRLVKNTDTYFFHYYKKWIMVAEHGPDEVNGSNDHFLRAYAGANEREFFAVCIEHFFEDPDGFAAELPVLYHHLTILLKQDPLRLKKYRDLSPVWTNNVPTPSQLNDIAATSEFSLLDGIHTIVLPFIILVAFTTVTAGQDIGARRFFIALSIVLTLGGMIDYFRRGKIFEVYNDFVIIRSGITGRILWQAAIENIISIEFNRNEVKDIIITYVDKGALLRYSYYSRLEKPDFDKLKTYFHQRDILMSR